MKGDIVYKNEDGNNLLVVRKSMEREIINEAHYNGHFAVQITMHSIKQKCFIPHLELKVTEVVNTFIKAELIIKN